MFNPFAGFRMPIPVDPQRPDGEQRIVGGELVLSKVFEIADHLAALREATTAEETRDTFAYDNIAIQVGATPQIFQFDPVPQGSVWQIDRFVSLPDDYNNYNDSFRFRLFRNAATADMYIGEVSSSSLLLQYALPLALQQGETIVVSASSNVVNNYRLGMYYREFNRGPQTLIRT